MDFLDYVMLIIVFLGIFIPSRYIYIAKKIIKMPKEPTYAKDVKHQSRIGIGYCQGMGVKDGKIRPDSKISKTFRKVLVS